MYGEPFHEIYGALQMIKQGAKIGLVRCDDPKVRGNLLRRAASCILSDGPLGEELGENFPTTVAYPDLVPSDLESGVEYLIKELIKEKFSKPFFVEYTREGQSVHHAHTHFIPLTGEDYKIESFLKEIIIPSKMNFYKEDRKKLKELYKSGGSYVRLGEGDQNYYVDVTNVPLKELFPKFMYRVFLKRKGSKVAGDWSKMSEEDKLNDEKSRGLTKEKLDSLKSS